MEYVGILTQQRRNNERFDPPFVCSPFWSWRWSISSAICFLMWRADVFDSYFWRGLRFVVCRRIGRRSSSPSRRGPSARRPAVVYHCLFCQHQHHQFGYDFQPLPARTTTGVRHCGESLHEPGMKMPKINIIDDDSLNAFASGINGTTMPSPSRKASSKSNDEGTQAVARSTELSHIRNHDVRLMIISIVFKDGIGSMLAQFALKSIYLRRSWAAALVTVSKAEEVPASSSSFSSPCSWPMIGYFFSILMLRHLRKREYLADAGSAEDDENPLARPCAEEDLRRSRIECVRVPMWRSSFIEHPGPQLAICSPAFSIRIPPYRETDPGTGTVLITAA